MGENRLRYQAGDGGTRVTRMRRTSRWAVPGLLVAMGGPARADYSTGCRLGENPGPSFSNNRRRPFWASDCFTVEQGGGRPHQLELRFQVLVSDAGMVHAGNRSVPSSRDGVGVAGQ